MFELRCTVRNCTAVLKQHDNALRCDSGHHFDRAKAGYWSLLQPQDRKSLKPGDSDDAVLARHRWLKRGLATGLVETLRPWIKTPTAGDDSRSIRTLDLGCGEGSFGPALFSDTPNGYCGIDLSKRAIKLAARGWPEATWVLANADRTLPAADGSVDQVISLFGRRPADEISRVLVSDGNCIIAVPGEEDLIELRESVQQEGHRRSRWEAVVDELSAAGLQFVEHQNWRHRVELEPDAIADALAMTYRAVRHSQQTRAESLTAMAVTLAADLILLRRS
ncbi:methyltransferase domain-containing protein [Stieleria sp. ICT_E10.1]|uniref:methyltransferase domain-containing protein n=1 Tax=Stieleria sedimenti TaxID=2976331 RepID=UPI00217FE3C0|nr:methyltransferase domain-containing protein [Stieleria sedimenti]MCS7469715.1 methyltransferase domain-containing protein [Stieleria sedimenti]